ncbi:virulence-associated E family protein [Geomicrobium sediminis]|uniref:P-loop ATPase n=1 Tax=Geomicrobium sediminis TaxID=1347788 RepID=A0ABS2P7Z9_9BACL|nr:virulence-associated E family protein [Geomicrobium sediminis]MBM7631116.1 putative P-loop ATPase [Geomicrobium sediminis]
MIQYDRQLTISSAGSRRDTLWPSQTIHWSDMVEKLRYAVRGTETLDEYLKMRKPEQDERKDVGGFVGGTLRNNRRKAANVEGRDLVTLDLDNIDNGYTDYVISRVDSLGCAYAIYSTRKHEPTSPRLRVLFPVNRTMTADEYEPIARKLADMIGISFADPTTFKAERLMYWPSVSADSQYVFTYGDKQMVNVDGMLNLYQNWRDVQEWPEVPGAAKTHVRMAAKQGDPASKPGVVGAFCRQYDIHQAIETFLPGIYEMTDDGSGRYTFIDGSTVGGAVVYDDGAFLYSHHATDPTGGRLVNAFDLVRLHKYSDEDDEAKPDTPINRMPSFSKMSAFALNDADVATAINQEKYEQMTEDFGGTSTPATKVDTEWIKRLEVSASTGKPAKTIANVELALANDQNLAGKIMMDTFADAILAQGPFPWAPREDDHNLFMWTDRDDAGLRSYMEKILGFKVKDTINDALVIGAARNRFNPVVDYLNSLEWDGVHRLDRLFIDYMGAADTSYIRAVTRKSFIAAVARAMVPGIKHDTMPVLTGAQGLGKTTLIQKMGQSWFTNSIESFEGKDAAELLQGVWIVEVGEMSAYSKSDVNTIKGFLSRTEDQYRAAYARKAEKHPRKCVFFGTSNQSDYLKDATGGRRFWPVDVGVTMPVKSVFTDLDEEIDQLWAEAVAAWRSGEITFLTGALEEEAKRQQEMHTEQDPRQGLVQDFLERPVPLDWQKKSIEQRKMYWSNDFKTEAPETASRDRVCAAEVWVECFNNDLKFMKRHDTVSINSMIDNVVGWQKLPNPSRYGPYGKVRGGFVKS